MQQAVLDVVIDRKHITVTKSIGSRPSYVSIYKPHPKYKNKEKFIFGRFLLCDEISECKVTEDNKFVYIITKTAQSINSSEPYLCDYSYNMYLIPIAKPHEYEEKIFLKPPKFKYANGYFYFHKKR